MHHPFRYLSGQARRLLTRAAAVSIGLSVTVSAAQAQSAEKATSGDSERLTCYSAAVATEGAAKARSYLLASGDQIQIMVYQREDLTGARTIAEDGTISLPLIGRINATGKTTFELEGELAKAIEQSTGRSEHASISLVSRKPVYVIGLVNNPGAFPFSANMTVLHAIALSGGLFRPDVRQGGLTAVTREHDRIGQATLRLKQALADEARIKAELESKTVLETPQRLSKISEDNEAKRYIQRQADIMSRRKEAMEKEIASLEQSAQLSKLEIKSLEERMALIKDQIKLANQELQAFNKLKAQGLMRRADLFTIHRVISGLESDLRAIETNVVRSRRNEMEAHNRIEQLKINQNLALQQELNQTENNIAMNDASIRSSQWIVGELMAANQEQSDNSEVLSFDYEIVRNDSEVHKVIGAQELTLLCPGDVVRVQPGSLQ